MLIARRLLQPFRDAPALTLTAVLSLALGIGVTTTVFSLVDAFLLRALPVEDPDALVLLRAVHGVQGRLSRRGEGPGVVDPATGRASGTPFSLLAYERVRAAASSAGLEAVWAFSPFSQVHVLVNGVPETTPSAQYVSGSYFDGLGVGAVLGRVITADDDRPAAAPVAVISDRFWRRGFDRAPAALGAVILVNRVPTTIVGVTPPGFDGAQQAGETADISVALALHPRFQPDRAERAQPYYWWLRIMGRAAPGARTARIRAVLEPVVQAAAREGWEVGLAALPTTAVRPDDPRLEVDPAAQGEDDVRRQYAPSLRLLMGLVGLVLAAACANVANLLLARAEARRREIAVRAALGEPPARLLRGLFVESLAVAGAGAFLGVLLAWWGRALLLAVRPFGATTVVLDLPLDARVLSFTIAVTAMCAVLCGLAPALRALRVDVKGEFLGGPAAIGGGGARLRRTLLVAQVALSLVLLVSTGLFARTVARLQAVDAGFARDHLALFRVDATSAGFDPVRAGALHARIRERLARLPGVGGATFSRVALLSRTRQNMRFSVAGASPPTDPATTVLTNGIDPTFLEVMGLRLLSGRGVEARDRPGNPLVVLVNETFARSYVGTMAAVGHQVVFRGPIATFTAEIVGVVHDAKYTDLRGPTPATAYFAAAQQPDGMANFAVRAAGDPAALLPAIRAALREVDPEVPVLDLRRQDAQIDRLHGQERLFERLSAFFGVSALLLACVGLYGLLSDAVSRRRMELGLRLALGAKPDQVRALVVRDGLGLALLGVALGDVTAVAVSRLLTALLFEVSATDPAVYAGASTVLLATALVAAWLPARQASRLEPLPALRTP